MEEAFNLEGLKGLAWTIKTEIWTKWPNPTYYKNLFNYKDPYLRKKLRLNSERKVITFNQMILCTKL